MDRKITTDCLKVGMYVSRLDRPWVQTPYLIQGFYIKDSADILSLEKYCDFVYIDIELGKTADFYSNKMPTVSSAGSVQPLPDKKQKAPVATGVQIRQRLSANRQVEKILDSGKKSVNYVNKKTTIEELPEAKAALDTASKCIAHMMEHDFRNGKLDVVKIKQAVEPILNSVIRNSDAFMWLSKMQDYDTSSYEHSVQNCALGIAFGRHLGLDKRELNTLATGLLLMDIGKIRLPRTLLTKKTPLSPEEEAVMRTHVDFTVEILRKTKSINEHVINIALTHHERYDGSGYPNGLSGMQTPAFGRIAAIIDCYDAMITPTPYRPSISEHKALQNIYNLREKFFQRELVEQFMQCMGVYPTGSLVELSSGAVAAVVSQNAAQRMKPSIMMLLDENKQAYKKHKIIDLDKQGKVPVFITKSLENMTYGVDIKQVGL